MNTMTAIVKIAARGICGMINCSTCAEIFSSNSCPYSMEVPETVCIKTVDYVMQKLREKAEVSPVTEDDLVDILSEEL